uniref:F5/8 type C domain-containing protein n=1 Tax=Paramormyrops kingsleyae TaxID=1676925 RepID=A0A3B3QBF1_9TELE
MASSSVLTFWPPGKHTATPWVCVCVCVCGHSPELSPPSSLSLAGCYGTLGLESGVVRSSQITGSSVWEWSDENGQPSVWQPSGARLKRPGLPWAAAHSDQHQWLQVDLKKRKRITGEKKEEQCSGVGAEEARNDVTPELTIFQGNINYLHEVRNNFIPPVEARYVRVSPTQWHQRIALKMELLVSHCSEVFKEN